MTTAIESVTTAALALALDAASLRQQAISANVANHATPGFGTLKLDFESQMEDARRALDSKGRLDASSLANVQLQLAPALDANGQPVRVQIDEQMADMAQNAVHYQALARGLSRHYSILSSAVSDGKR